MISAMLRLDVVIPALNAAAVLPAVLADVAGARVLESRALVVDGGSGDGTRTVAAAGGATVIESPRGRGVQLAAGAVAADAPWLLFLHADSRLPPDWDEAIADFAADPANRQRAAVFRLRFDDENPMARRIEALAAWRSRALGLPYGDQGLVIARPFYDSLGGFRPLPLMEDVDLVSRIGRRRLVTLDLPLVTSAARYRRSGYLPRTLRNLLCLSLWRLGVAPRVIARLYG